MNHKDAGKMGEKHAVDFLNNKCYSVLHTNFQTRYGELDIVAQSPEGVTVFVEVKSSRSERAGDPVEWVTPAKQKKIYKLARFYNSKFGSEDEAMRFDVIAVRGVDSASPNIEHYENAFIPDTSPR